MIKNLAGRSLAARVIGVTAAVIALAGTGISGVPAIASAAAGSAPPSPTMVSASHVGVLKPRAPRVVKAPVAVPAATSWPSAASAVVSLAGPAPLMAGAAQRAAMAMTSAGTQVPGPGTPLWAERVPGHAGSVVRSVRLGVLPHTAAAAAGVRGVLFTVSAGSGSPGGPVTAGISYAGFAQASGGNYGLGLGLAELPACVLTTPAKPSCQKETPLPSSVNNPAAQSVSAQVSVPSSGTMVLAATTAYSDGGGAAGTYAATTLKPSGTWNEGGSSGAFTYSYPLQVPSAVSSLVPSLSLDYDSGSVDGQTAATQAQASWIGDGWTLGGGSSFIEQSFKPCQDDPEGAASSSSTPDQCYDGPVVTWSQDGSSDPLVCPVPFSYTADSTCTASADDGEVITHHVSSGNGSGSQFTDYWTITTRDGTTYYFGLNRLPGWASGDASTNSTDTMPVYSAHSGDPCYSSSSFHSCPMAYRWNLDYVTDVHGNAMAFYYGQDANAYAADGATSSAVSYIRDSHLDHIDYGFTNGNAYQAHVPDKVVFGTGDRCFSGTCDPLNATNASNWQDVPYTQDYCAAGSSCQVNYPTFWSTVRLSSVTTEQWNGSAYAAADAWTLGQEFPATGDGTSPALFLDSVTREGEDTAGGGGPVTLPSVTFTPVQLANRVNPGNYPALVRSRIGDITTETGSQIAVTYETTSTCNPSSYPAPSSNTSSCFPVYWQQFTPSAGPDWFNKYAVQSVSVSDPTGGSPGTYTSYSYSGAAWHYDDNELVEAQYRTWGQWRGYHDVVTDTGTGTDTQTENETTYYQGMSDDDNSTAVTLTDSQGGTHDDANQLAGDVLETTAYDGRGGPVDHSAIDSYWVSAAVATRTRSGLPALTANVTGQVEEWARQAITDSGTTSWRKTETDTSYDATPSDAFFGLPLYVFAHGDLSDTSQQTCTATTYAPPNASENLVGLVAEKETDAVACGGSNPGGASAPGSGQVNALTAPASVSRPGQVVSDTRTFYDNPALAQTWPPAPAWPQAAPTKGDVSFVEDASGYSNGAFTYQAKTATVYDSYGRPVASYDGNGNKTTTSYTMTNGVTTAETVTNPLGQATTTTYDPVRALPLTTTDPNSILTTLHYDGLGRLTGVWEDNRTTSEPASIIYSYAVSDSAPTVVTTQTLNDESGYITSTTLYDALLRARQTQDPTPQGGVLVTDHFYNSDGWEWKTNTNWWDSSANPGSSILTVPDSQVPDQTETAYDGLGRPIMVTSYDDSAIRRQTATAYYGDKTLTVPPQGGTPKATITDALGRTSELDSYTSRPTVTTTSNSAGAITGVAISGGSYQATDYTYGPNQLLSTIKDATTGEKWGKTYNLLGQVTGTTDPNSGATTNMSYDADGNLTSSTDADDNTLLYTYDALDRKTSESSVTSSGTMELASWAYDNSNGVAGVTDPIGHLTTETSYANGNAYTIQQKGFNVFGESLGETVTLPAAEGTLSQASYILNQTYSSTTGLLLRSQYTTSTGSGTGTLPDETLTYGYQTGFDLPAGLSGLAAYTQNITWNDQFQMQQEEIGSTTSNAYITDTYDPNNGALTDSKVQNTATDPTAIYDDTSYAYDPSGNITAETDTRNGSQSETQCFGYDTLDRLTEAWTATDNCAAAPSTNSGATVGDGIPGSAYWTSWAYNPLGDRTSQTQHATTSGGTNTVTSYHYGNPVGGQPDTLTAASTTGATTSNAAYGFDPAGNMTTGTLNGATQTLNWSPEGKLSTAISGGKTTSYIYDADGNLLLAKAPGQTTLYLFGGAEQIYLTVSTQAVTGTRFISLPGGGEAVRTGTGTAYTFEITNQQGTGVLTLNSSCQDPAWRQYDPYGNPRGTAPASWPDTNAFLGKPTDATTGLDILGARDYTPALGRFISADPILEQNSPQELNGYNYAADNPVTNADPSGASMITGEGGCAGAPKGTLGCPSGGGSGGGGGGGGGNGGNGGNGGSGGGGSNRNSGSSGSTIVYQYIYTELIGPVTIMRSPAESMKIFEENPTAVFPFPITGCHTFYSGEICTLHPSLMPPPLTIGPLKLPGVALPDFLTKPLGGIGVVRVSLLSSTSFRFTVIAPGYFDARGSTITFSLSQRNSNLYLSQHGVTTGENTLGHFAYAAGLSGLTWDRQAVNLASVLDPQYPDPDAGPTPSLPLGPSGSPQPEPTVAPGG